MTNTLDQLRPVGLILGRLELKFAAVVDVDLFGHGGDGSRIARMTQMGGKRKDQ